MNAIPCGRDARTTTAVGTGRENCGAGVSPALFLVSAVLVAIGCGSGSEIERKLGAVPGMTVTAAATEDLFGEGFDLRLEQPLDHEDPSAGTFSQRIELTHRGFDRPVVLITEGYFLDDNRIGELASLLDANQIRVEHRFVGESVPETIDWDLLTIDQSSADYHRLRGLLAKIYPGPWVSTGWSKGGQTALIYRSRWPEDVVATVAYDSPLPRALEDPRLEEFFSMIGTVECRSNLVGFQRAALASKAEILPLFSAYASENGHVLSLGEMRILEYVVLEFPFSFWQYSDADCDDLPGDGAEPEALFEKLVEVVGLSWFADDNLDSPPFHQFCTELGYYGFVTDHLVDFLDETDYPNCRWAPDWAPTSYDPEPMRRLDEWLRTEAERVMSIYGGKDPWAAAAIPFNGALDQRQFWNPIGNHFTFIESLSEDDRAAAVGTLKRWVEGIPEEEPAP